MADIKLTPAGDDANKDANNPDEKPAEIKIEAPAPTADKPAEPAGAETPATAEPEKKAFPTMASTLLKIGDKKEDTVPETEAKDDSGSKAFKNIFNQKKTEEKESEIVKTVLKEKAAPKVKSILGKAPTLQKSLDEQRQAKAKNTLRTVQTLLVAVFVLSMAMAGYFYTQLSPSFDFFGPNATATLTDINKKLASSQTKINKYRYLAAQLDLNTFSFVSDDFLDKTHQLTTNNLSPAETQIINDNIVQATNDLPGFLETIRENLTPGIVVETYKTEAEEEMTPEQIEQQFQTELKNALMADRKKLTEATDTTEINDDELRLYDNTLKLVGNTKLLNTIKNTSVDNFTADLQAYAETLDTTKRDELQSIIKSILASTKSDIATIGALKTQRISWSWIIDKIEEVTLEIDPNFNSGLFDVTGMEIDYTGYDFNSSTNKITLAGSTRTLDGRNFTLITDLIEALEDSPYFSDVEMRSFTKSGDIDKGFSSNFSIDLKIQEGGMTPSNSPISFKVKRIARDDSAKRIKR